MLSSLKVQQLLKLDYEDGKVSDVSIIFERRGRLRDVEVNNLGEILSRPVLDLFRSVLIILKTSLKVVGSKQKVLLIFLCFKKSKHFLTLILLLILGNFW